MTNLLVNIIAALSLTLPSPSIGSSNGILGNHNAFTPHHDYNTPLSDIGLKDSDIPKLFFPEYLSECSLSLGYNETIDDDFRLTQTFIELYNCEEINKPSHMYNIDVMRKSNFLEYAVFSFSKTNTPPGMLWGFNNNDAFEMWFNLGYMAVSNEGTYVNPVGEIAFITPNNNELIQTLAERYHGLASIVEKVK